MRERSVQVGQYYNPQLDWGSGFVPKKNADGTWEMAAEDIGREERWEGKNVVWRGFKPKFSEDQSKRIADYNAAWVAGGGTVKGGSGGTGGTGGTGGAGGTGGSPSPAPPVPTPTPPPPPAAMSPKGTGHVLTGGPKTVKGLYGGPNAAGGSILAGAMGNSLGGEGQDPKKKKQLGA